MNYVTFYFFLRLTYYNKLLNTLNIKIMIYQILVNGKLINSCTEGYDIAFQRALGIAMFLGISGDFINPTRPIIDKWSDGKQMILVVKKEK